MCRSRFLLVALAVLAGTSCGLADDGSATLLEAARKHDLAAFEEHWDRNANLHEASVDGMTALHWAVFHDDASMSRRLIERGADVTAPNRYGVTPLSIACQNGNGEIVRRLLDAGADPNSALSGGETVLMTASRTGKPNVVAALLDRGAEVDAKEHQGQTALMWAAAEGHGKVVSLLVAAGADPHASLRSGFTPFFFAVREGRSEVVERLLAAGIDVNEPMDGRLSETTPLVLAVENGHFELALAMVEAGADPNDGRGGHTSLHAITWVRKPLRGDGDPPPIGSGSVSSLEFVRRLVALGADVNARHGDHKTGNGRMNRTDATPFFLASETADVPLMQLLLELGADPHLVNADNCTALLAAAGVGVLGNGDESAGTEEEAIEAVSLLLDLGQDVNAVDDEGKTAMHGAAFKSWTKMVRFLADHGADINVWNQKNKRGWTPLMIAQGNRPGNFRPSPETIVAIQQVMREAGVEPPR